jgi:hypothetical protein
VIFFIFPSPLQHISCTIHIQGYTKNTKNIALSDIEILGPAVPIFHQNRGGPSPLFTGEEKQSLLCISVSLEMKELNYGSKYPYTKKCRHTDVNLNPKIVCFPAIR